MFAFAQRVEKEKHDRKSIKKRCEFILVNIPTTRNAGEKTFAKIYYEIWHGFKIRVKTSTVIDKTVWDRLPNQDTINREKRRCKQWDDEIKTYSPEVRLEQTAIYQALLEMAVGEDGI
jgi:predicted acetyltransferase